MLEAGAQAVEVMTEYVRACRRLGHSTPEPASLRAAYTAEDGMDLQALDADHRTLSETVAALEEALLLQEQARRTLAAAWRGAGAEAAADHLLRHTAAADDAVDGLRGTAAALGELRNRLQQLIDAKVGSAQDVEGRGLRTEWLSASRTVTTGVGDQAGASEMVDMQVAPFVANDIAVDWVNSMRDIESAVRQAYRDTASAIGAEISAVFERPGVSGSIPAATEQVSAPVSPASVAPAGVGLAPAAAGAAPAPIPAVPASPLSAPPLPPDPMAGVAPTAPMPAAASPLGSGTSGLSGLGQSFSDMLGGLLGSGGGGIGESLRGAGDLDSGLEDGPAQDELDGSSEPDDEGPDDEESDDEEGEDEEDQDDEPLKDEAPPGEPVGSAEAPEEPVAPLEATPEPPVPTPVPEPPAEAMVAESAEPVPAETPCEIAADELPQAGP